MKKISNQHGDVILEVVNEIPKEAKRVKVQDGFVVEKGEGIHTHILRKKMPCAKRQIAVAEIDEDVEIYQISDTMYIKVLKPVNIDHEEHGIQTLEPGIYKKNIEREYSYEQNEERRVID